MHLTAAPTETLTETARSNDNRCIIYFETIMKQILLALTLALFTGSCAVSQSKDAPNFSLQNSSGKYVELAKLKGKPVVVNFWATWCPPCKAEIPGFQKVYGKYHSKGLEIVGISLDEKGWSVVKPFVEKSKITYPVVLDNGDVAAKYGDIRSIPTTFFIDKKGKIVDSHVGYMAENDFENKIKKLL
jgi:cytochrome c biogenesis protein CcmG, thiol:disulfide interchange protein DsbE